VLVLGIHDGHNSSCALLWDGEIVAAVEEERLRRVKNWDARRQLREGPDRSLSSVLSTAGVHPQDVDQVAVAFSSPSEDRARLARLGHGRALDAAAFGPLAASKVWRMRKVKRVLAAAGVTAPLTQVHHHEAHGASAFLTSGFDRALALTLDGKGDLLSGCVYRVDRRGMTGLREIDQLDSLAILYSAVTRFLGYRTDEDEGKVTALSAAGRADARIDEALRRLFHHDGGEWRGVALRGHANPLQYVKQATGALVGDLEREIAGLGDVPPADLALGVQLLLERASEGLLLDVIGDDGPIDLCLAGGVFANVRLNKRLAELGAVRRTHVHPAMGDSGLAAGAAAAVTCRLGGELPSRAVTHVYQGPGFGDGDAVAALEAASMAFDRPDDPAAAVAGLLARGRTVAVCRGRMEFGPRALGHRSILHAPDDVAVGESLNRQLGRDPVMPFAPAILAEDVDRCLVARVTSDADAPFMTTSYDGTGWMREQCRGVVHVDGTVRPQVVTAEGNPFLHQLLVAYRERTGLPCLLNTSLNTHREPIACTPADAVGVYQRAGLDHLLVGDLLVGRA